MSDSEALAAPTPVEEMSKAELLTVLYEQDLQQIPLRQRTQFLAALASSYGLNPYAKPFDLIPLDGKLQVYATAGCAEQLADIRKLSTDVVYEGPLKIGEEVVSEIYCVAVRVVEQIERGEHPLFRVSQNVGCLPIGGLKGNGLSNAVMKCHTKANRRAVLKHCGVMFPDVSELDSIPQIRFQGGVSAPPTRALEPSEPRSEQRTVPAEVIGAPSQPPARPKAPAKPPLKVPRRG